MKRPIRPHKGGRTVRIFVRATPETKALLEKIARANNKTPADLIEQWTLEAAERLEQGVINGN